MDEKRCAACYYRVLEVDENGFHKCPMPHKTDGQCDEPVWNVGDLMGDQGKSLAEFASKKNLEQWQVDSLARLTGRGYRPPTHPKDWKVIWNAIKDHIEPLE